MDQLECFTQGFQWLEEESFTIEKEERRRLEAILYAFAVKLLDKEQLEKVKEVISMTELGRMLRDDGIEIGKEIGKEIGADMLGELTVRLLNESRLTDLQKAAEDSVYRKQLYKEYGIGMVHEDTEYQVKKKQE